MQRKSVVGTRSSLLWLLIVLVVVILISATIGVLVMLPQMQATRTEQARLAEIERHYQAGVAFQKIGDWTAAEGEYRQIISLDANYKDAQARLSDVRVRAKEIACMVTASACRRSPDRRCTGRRSGDRLQAT
ncbi:MAG: hypothetical protein FJ280_26190 [Planctomycetes bacterium]|nr:hypothetical protein [Planctomycetota bacterium]